jgi:hypothetical protein
LFVAGLSLLGGFRIAAALSRLTEWDLWALLMLAGFVTLLVGIFRLLRAMEQAPKDGASGLPSYFRRGSLAEVPLSSLLETIQQERASGKLTLRVDGPVPTTLYFLSGHLFHAVGDGAVGDGAVLRALTRSSGDFEFDGWARLLKEESVTTSIRDLIARADGTSSVQLQPRAVQPSRTPAGIVPSFSRRGSLAGIPLSALLETIERERASGRLTLRWDGPISTTLYFLSGRLYHAVGDGAFGDEAVFRALDHSAGDFEFDSGARLPADDTIRSSIRELIARAARGHPPAPLPARDDSLRPPSVARRGSLGDQPLSSLLQAVEQEGASGKLTVVGHGRPHTILYFLHGQLYHAVGGDAVGDQAVIQALSCTSGHFEFNAEAWLPDAESIRSSLPELIVRGGANGGIANHH